MHTQSNETDSEPYSLL